MKSTNNVEEYSKTTIEKSKYNEIESMNNIIEESKPKSMNNTTSKVPIVIIGEQI